MKKDLFIFFTFFASFAYSQSAELTPVKNIGMHSVAVNIPSKYIGIFPAGKMLNVLTNYTVSVYHAGGLTKPRFMTFSPSGVLHVSDQNAGKVFAMPDVNMDGIADTLIEAASGFSGNHDVKFYKGAMYVTEATRIWKCTDNNDDGIYETQTIFINNISNQGGGHITRTIVFDSINQKVYVSVGSSCNVCRETARAIIECYDEDGTNRRVFATGIRNAVGMALHPVTNRLWANNNGSDEQGNETPPEWIDIVRDSGFYGHPFVYGSGVWFDFGIGDYNSLLPITAIDSAKVALLIQPAALIRAHSAPMGLQFLNTQFDSSLQYGFLSALRGSWNTTNPRDFRGYKVIYGHLSSTQDTTVDYVSDFCSGFITDTVNRTFWGRPVGIAIDNNGKVYISSDEGNRFILVLTPNNFLPVKLIDISADNAGTDVTINWTTASEANLSSFIVERLVGKGIWTKVGQVKANNFKSSVTHYRLSDPSPFTLLSSHVIYYRLKMLDADGSFTYSKIVTVKSRLTERTLSVYPNPVENRFTVTSERDITNIEIVDMFGNVQVVSFTTENGQVIISSENLKQGIYIIRATCGNEVLYRKITK